MKEEIKKEDPVETPEDDGTVFIIDYGISKKVESTQKLFLKSPSLKNPFGSYGDKNSDRDEIQNTIH